MERTSRAAYMRQYRKENPIDRRNKTQQNRAFHQRRREQAFKHYGGSCRCCGERLVELLTLTPQPNHNKCPSGQMIAQWLFRQGYPEGYDVMCVSCVKTHDRLGYCPHSEGAI